MSQFTYLFRTFIFNVDIYHKFEVYTITDDLYFTYLLRNIHILLTFLLYLLSNCTIHCYLIISYLLALLTYI